MESKEISEKGMCTGWTSFAGVGNISYCYYVSENRIASLFVGQEDFVLLLITFLVGCLVIMFCLWEREINFE